MYTLNSGANVNYLIRYTSSISMDKKSTVHRLRIPYWFFNYPNKDVTSLICRGVDMQSRDAIGRTALFYAAEQGLVEMTKLCLEKGAEVNVADENGRTPFLEAAKSREACQLLPLLMKHGADVTVKDNFGWNALHCLAYSPSEHITDLARSLITEKGISLDDKDYSDEQPINVAAFHKNHELVKLFLDHGANVNARSHLGRFPLYHAAMGSPAMLETLLKHGANIDMKTSFGETALHAACKCRAEIDEKRDCLRLLLSAGADWEGTPFALLTHGSSLLGHIETTSDIRLLLRTLALRKVCQPSIELKDEEIIEKRPNVWKYYRYCLEHVPKVISTTITEGCTVLELLTKCQCEIAALMRSPQFQSKFMLHDLNVFAMYAEDIFEAFDRAERFYRSILEHEDLIDEAFYRTLPHMIVRKIVRYTLDCKMQKNCPSRPV